MKRFLRVLVWDALYCLLPTVGYAAQSLLNSSAANDVITLLVFAFCGIFLSQLSRWGTSPLEFCFTAIPAVYIALAPFFAPMLALIPIPFSLVPAILLSSQTTLLRTCWALAAGFICWQKVSFRVS